MLLGCVFANGNTDKKNSLWRGNKNLRQYKESNEKKIKSENRAWERYTDRDRDIKNEEREGGSEWKRDEKREKWMEERWIIIRERERERERERKWVKEK